MSFFRFCRQGLTALPVFLVFTSCDKLLPTGGNGGLIPVKIRSVSVKGYGEASATRSAGGEKRIIGEPIVQDLGDGLLAEITVEEDVSALRDGPSPKKLGGGVKFRIIALQDGKLFDYADYTMPESEPSGGALTPDEGSEALECEVGQTYNFICYSYNSSADLPDWSDENLSALSVDNSKDLLYWLDQNNTIEDGEALLINMTQQLAKVTLVLDAGGRVITSVANNSIKISPVATPTTFDLTATENALTGTTLGEVFFTGWESGTTLENSLRLLSTGSAPTLSLSAEAITVNGTLKSKETTFSLPAALTVGSSYTIRIKPVLKFAGSNIYWNGSELTFDKNDGAGNEKYQGVYFKWGSLIGIAAGADGEDYISGSTALYKPTNTSDPVGTARTWTTTTDTDDAWSGSGWSNIPSYYGTSMTSGETLLSKGDAGFGDFKGDICYYINSDYRMPTQNELKDIIPDPYNNFNQVTDDIPGTSDDDKAGKYTFTDNFATLKDCIFPASGHRSSSNGMLNNVGGYGYYWSSSPYSGSNYAYELYIISGSGSGGGAYTNYASDRRYANPVRCVKN